MTMSPTSLPPLLTDDDVLERVASLLGPATKDRCLWLLLVDGDRKQTPVLMPIEDTPPRPDPRMVDGLVRVLGQVADALVTSAGAGSAVFVLERTGHGTVTTADAAWGEALRAVCESSGLGLLGVFTSTVDGVHRVR
ncbi:hypothetical protein [Actinomycetospora atypica]|uniref:Uncharacterized protein n=1 Tax=Actinomycetospora atypica TaxID=1290095 RepID=A0ABV9YNL4_9PSEU